MVTSWNTQFVVVVFKTEQNSNISLEEISFLSDPGHFAPGQPRSHQNDQTRRQFFPTSISEQRIIFCFVFTNGKFWEWINISAEIDIFLNFLLLSVSKSNNRVWRSNVIIAASMTYFVRIRAWHGKLQRKWRQSLMWHDVVFDANIYGAFEIQIKDLSRLTRQGGWKSCWKNIPVFVSSLMKMQIVVIVWCILSKCDNSPNGGAFKAVLPQKVLQQRRRKSVLLPCDKKHLTTVCTVMPF